VDQEKWAIPSRSVEWMMDMMISEVLRIRSLWWAGSLALFLSGWFWEPAFSADVVLNDGFELESTDLWTETGNVPFYHRGVVKFDVTGDGKPSWAYYQHPGGDYSGGVEQVIYVLEGVTYRVSADICYHNG
jgi:hypothetical protein